MTFLAALLATIGIADLVRRESTDRRRLGFALAVASVFAVVIFWGLGLGARDIWLLLIALLLIGLWTFSETIPVRGSERLALAGLAAAVMVLLAFGQHLDRDRGWLDTWYSSLAIDTLEGVPFEKFMLAAGCLLLMLNTANLIVRLVLKGAGPGVIESAKTLKGGRILGPLERIFIFAMGVSGQFAAIGAVVAAKGILRFPEISRADDNGNKAEYVLVGSFVSWLLALIFVPLF